MSFPASTGDVSSGDVRDLIVTAIEGRSRRRARSNQKDSHRKLQSNGMAEVFVRTTKRDYFRVNPRPNAERMMRPLLSFVRSFGRYNKERRNN